MTPRSTSSLVASRTPAAPTPEQYAAWAARPQDEIVALRGPYSKVFRINNDVNMLVLSSGPKHYLSRETGEWEEIDTTVKPVGTPEPGRWHQTDFEWAMTRNEYHSYFRQSATDAYLVRYEARGAAIEFGVEAQQPWGRLKPIRAQVQGNQVVYPDLFPDVDLRYELSPERQLEEFVVKQPEVAQQIRTIEKRFRAEGVNWQMEADGSIRFTHRGSGEELWRVPRPVMYERGGDAAARSYGLHFELEEREGYVILRKVIEPDDLAWLRANRRLPIFVDDTVDLSHTALTTGTPLDAGYGDGYVSQSADNPDCTGLNGGYVRSDSAETNYIGCFGSAIYRAFFEWNTQAIKDKGIQDADILSLGIYLNGNMTQGYNNPVVFKQLTDRPSNYTKDALWSAIASATPYHSSINFGGGNNYFNLGCRPVLANTACTSDQAIADLVAGLPQATPVFHFGMMGGAETGEGVYASYAAKEATTGGVGVKPDLVLFYKGAAGSYDVPDRPLRDTFWDGTNYWLFYTTSDTTGIQYTYSSDGATWATPTEYNDTDTRSKHHAIWYWYDSMQPVGQQHRVALAYHVLGNVGLAGDLRVNTGYISGKTIVWATATPALDAPDNYGYDFPSIVRDSSGYCWLAGRYGPAVTPPATPQYSQILVRSSSTTDNCASWPGSSSYITVYGPHTLNTTVDFLSTGGYVVPLTTGQVYVVYKDRDPIGNTNPIYGNLCSATGCDAQQTIEADAGQGVYTFGLTAVAVGDEVHLVYVDCTPPTPCTTNSTLQYTYRCPSPGTWASPTPVVTKSAVYFNPSLTRDDNTANDLYMFFRSDRGLSPPSPTPPSAHSASGAVYYKKLTRPVVQCTSYTWDTTDSELTNGLVNLWSPVDSSLSGYSLLTNYSSRQGPAGSVRKIIAAWVEGIYAMDAIILSPSP